MKVQTTLRGQAIAVSGATLTEIAEKVSKFAGFTLTPEDIVAQGIWSVVYRHDYAEKRPRKTGAGETKVVKEL